MELLYQKYVYSAFSTIIYTYDHQTNKISNIYKYTKNGDLIEYIQYEKNEHRIFINYIPKKQITSYYYLNNKHNKSIKYHKSGNIKTFYNYKVNKKYGLYKHINIIGRLYSIGYYINNNLHGTFDVYNNKGEISYRQYYHHGCRNYDKSIYFDGYDEN